MFGSKRKASDFTSEIEAHIELEIERYQEQGLSYDEAHVKARRAFGNVTRAQERFYESRRWLWWEHFGKDVRYAMRMLRKSPGFAATCVVTVALAIGATTAIFSVVNATLLHPLPYPQPEQLVSIEDDLAGIGARNVGLSEPEWQDLQHSGIFEYVSPAWFDENNMTGASEPARVSLLIVAPNYFALLGVKPQMGGSFDPQNHTPGFTGEAVISDGLWKRTFGSDPHIVGKNIRLDTDLYRIIGVMPAGFRSPGPTPAERRAEVWVATSFYGAPLADHPARNRQNLPEAIARLKPGLTLEAAQGRLDALVTSLRKQYPADYPQQTQWKIRLTPLKETLVGNVRRPLVLLFGAVALVMLIACVNVANLLLARATARAREMAMRQALGAARRRLVSQLLTESLVLSLLGGVAGIALLLAMERFLLRLVPESLPQLNGFAIDWSVLLFATAATLICGAVFGLVPATSAGRLDLVGALKDAARGSTGSGKDARTRRMLVVAELALSLVLTVAAGLLLRSFADLLHVPLGFCADRVMTIRTRLPYPNDVKTDKYAKAAQQAPFLRELLRRSKTLPGVEEAAIGDSGSIPLDASQRELNRLAGRFFFTVEGRDLQGSQKPVVDRWMVTPTYFHLLGIALLRGRLFDEFDDDKTPQVAVVNEAFARTYWPEQDAIGKRFRSDRAGSAWITVVGVAANARTGSLADADAPEVYLSLYQTPSHHLAIFLRGQMDAATIPQAVREQVQSVDPTLPVFGARMLTQTVSASLSERRFSMEMLGLFALTALFMAGIGTYGVISYMVSARTHEFGIRMALGARRTGILKIVLQDGLRLATLGAVFGLAGALITARFMAGVLYGVRATDIATLATVAVVLAGIALLASYVPARRAVNVDPMLALRCE